MKNIKLLFSFLLIALLSSCSDEAVDPALLNQSNNTNNNNSNNGNTAGVLTAKIDGVDFSSTSNSGTYTAVGTNTQLFLSGNTSDGKTITISITNPAVGTVNASLSSCVLAYASQGTFFTSTNPATSTSVGTVTLTSFDTVNNRVTGTFSFTGYNNDGTITRQIANGSINSFPFTNSVTSGGNNGGTAVFKADFNGTTWTATDVEANIYNNVIQISGVKSALGQGFALSLNGSTAQTYDSLTNLFVYTPNINNQDYYWSSDAANPTTSVGSVVVTNIDSVNHTISGTFDFTGYWTDPTNAAYTPIHFTNGVFTNIPYTTDAPVATNFFDATIDGTQFNEDNIDVAFVQSPGFPDSWSIVGSTTAGNSIGLRISANYGVGTYNFTGPLALDLTSHSLIDGVLYSAESGTLTITSKTAGRMTGTFNSISKNIDGTLTKTITNGSFDVEFP